MAALTEIEDQGDPNAMPWSLGVFDAHCHPTDTMSSIPNIPRMGASALTIMATRAQDQELVAETANKHKVLVKELERELLSSERLRGVIPSFGWHPWFSHQIFDDVEPECRSYQAKAQHYESALTPKPEDETFLAQLPDPMPLSKLLKEIRENLEKSPEALVGEIGLDKAFRLPEVWVPRQEGLRDDSLTPGGREGRRLSPYRVSPDHQIAILSAQLRLAGEMQRAVSVHGVQAHGILFETIRKTWKGSEREVLSKSERKRRRSVPNAHDTEDDERPTRNQVEVANYPPRICLHSYSGPADFVREYLHPSVPADIYFSFSILVNFATSAARKTEEVIRRVPDDKILIESDMHIAGHDMDQKLEEIARKVCTLKGWALTEGVKILARNWKRFVFGFESRIP